MQDWEPRFEWKPLIEVPPQPAAPVERSPVDRALGPCALAPPPTLLIPKFPSLVAPVIHERGELGVRHCGPRNGKWLHLDWMRPHFIIKDELRAWLAAEQEGYSGDLGVSHTFHRGEETLICLSALGRWSCLRNA